MAQKSAKRKPPQEVERAISLWLIAVGAGIIETLLRVAHAFAVQPTPGSTVWDASVRMLLWTGLWSLVLRLRKGEHWVRLALAVTLGGIAVLFAVTPALTSMLAGHSALGFLSEADGWSFAFAVPQTVYTIAALLAIIIVFSPESGRFFLRSRFSGPARKRSPRRKAASARRRR